MERIRINMGFFDSVYDEMSLEEVSYRLPSDLAIRALKRRVLNLDTLIVFFASVGAKPTGVPELKEHVNSILASNSTTDILDKFEEKYHPTLFSWCNDSNRKRIKEDGSSKLTVKLLHNMTDAKDAVGMETVLDRVLANPTPTTSEVGAVLRKADLTIFPNLVNKVVRDQRPEVRSCLLALGDQYKAKMLGDNTRLVALKAWAKSGVDLAGVDKLDFGLFSTLRPAERMTTLKRYLGFFPLYRKAHVFLTDPTEDELDLILFAGCMTQTEDVAAMKTLYNQITKEDKPAEEDA
jgi:hypothetical protein